MKKQLYASIISLLAASAAQAACPDLSQPHAIKTVEMGDGTRTRVIRHGPDRVEYETTTNNQTTRMVVAAGMFTLESNREGSVIRFSWSADPARILPYKAGSTFESTGIIEQPDGRKNTMRIVAAVGDVEEIEIGACKYRAVKILSSESFNGGPAHEVVRYINPETSLSLRFSRTIPANGAAPARTISNEIKHLE